MFLIHFNTYFIFQIIAIVAHQTTKYKLSHNLSFNLKFAKIILGCEDWKQCISLISFYVHSITKYMVAKMQYDTGSNIFFTAIKVVKRAFIRYWDSSGKRLLNFMFVFSFDSVVNFLFFLFKKIFSSITYLIPAFH